MKEEVVESILRKIPRPNYSEIPQLYNDLDEMSRKIARYLMGSSLFDDETHTIHFERADERTITRLIGINPSVMIPFFTMICGLSTRELERLHGIKNVYNLSKRKIPEFARVVVELLNFPLSLETVLYKFYKNWEEHQKRHYRAKKAESYVIEFLRRHGYEAGKISVECGEERREIDCAIPPDRRKISVVIQVRTGVFRDLIKRVKEYSSEYDLLLSCYPNIRFVVVYFVSPHERYKIEEIRKRIEEERIGKRPYDFIVLQREDLQELISKLEEWKVPRYNRGEGS